MSSFSISAKVKPFSNAVDKPPKEPAIAPVPAPTKLPSPGTTLPKVPNVAAPTPEPAAA